MNTKNYTSIDHLLNDQKSDQSTHIASSPEGEPISISTEVPSQKAEVDITVEQDPKIEDAEVKEYLKVQQDTPEIHPKLKEAGLEAIHHDTLDDNHKVELPLPDEEVLEGLHQPINTSWRWLAEMAFFMLKQAHLGLKRIHGHVVRVMQR